MRRLFGGKKEEEPVRSLGEVGETAGKTVAKLEEKIKAAERKLVEYKQQLKAQRPGPVQNRTRERAKQLLQQKKMWEKQMAQMSGVQFNIEQVAFTQENIVSAIEVSKAMKVGAKDLKAQMKNLSLGEIEDNMDDMADLLEDANEIQETLGRSYAVDDDVDDLELDEELAALDEELGMLEAEETDTPAYLVDDPAPAEEPSAPAAVATGEQVDEFGLPVAAQ